MRRRTGIGGVGDFLASKPHMVASFPGFKIAHDTGWPPLCLYNWFSRRSAIHRLTLTPFVLYNCVSCAARYADRPFCVYNCISCAARYTNWPPVCLYNCVSGAARGRDGVGWPYPGECLDLGAVWVLYSIHAPYVMSGVSLYIYIYIYTASAPSRTRTSQSVTDWLIHAPDVWSGLNV